MKNQPWTQAKKNREILRAGGTLPAPKRKKPPKPKLDLEEASRQMEFVLGYLGNPQKKGHPKDAVGSKEMGTP